MPNLQAELRDLALADDHISRAERSIADVEQSIASERATGRSTPESEAALDAMHSGLDAFRAHRQLIVNTIADIRAGRLPST